VVLGWPLTLACTADKVVESCQWKYNGRLALNHHQKKEEHACTLVIEHLTEADLGAWSCQASLRGVKGYQEASRQLAKPDEKVTNVRLPTHLAPVSYDIFALPFLVPENWTIAGLVGITLEVMESSDNITMHINDILVHESEVRVSVGETELKIAGHGYDEERQFYIIHLAEQLQVGTTITVGIGYTGNLNPDLVGFYRSSYTDSAGELHWLATTQFETTEARRAFPCLDEPIMKAKFRVNLARLPHMSSISNMPIKNESVPLDGTDYVLDVFEESLKMSTYLVAMVVSDFVYRESEPLENGIPFRIWTRPEYFSQTEYAATIGPQILQFYESYFNTSFPLPKQDMIAVPDFGAGAMENWGLIAYREYALLYEEGATSDADKEYVADVIAHELAHQWFGDLVTMEWWTDLWLNEGFAAYTEFIGTDLVLPEANFLDQFLPDSLWPALQLDSLLSSHPISIEVNDPVEINQIFDTISYKKGSSVIRMMANFLGINTFNMGITNYLHGNAYGNANQDNLWQFLTEAALEDGAFLEGNSIKDIMDTWTLQTGYPLVTASRRDNSVTVSQARFLLSPEAEADEDFFWWVPVSHCSPGGDWENTAPKFWLPNSSLPLTFQLDIEADTPLVINVKQTGFYRVNYDQANWALIADQLLNDHQGIHLMNRAQLLDDAFNVAKAGFLDYRVALDQTLYLGEETEYIPWSAAISGFGYLSKMLRRTAGFGAYKSYMLAVVEPLYARLGYDEIPGEPVADSLLRVAVLDLACGLGHPDCVARSVGLLQQWKDASDPDLEDPIPSYARSTALCTAIAAGSSSDWDFVYQRYLASNNPTIKVTFLEVLSCSTEDWVLERYLSMSLTEEFGVKKADGYRVISGVATKTLGRYVAWNWIRDNWAQLRLYFDNGLSTRFKIIISSVADDFNTAFDLKELEEFVEENEGNLGSAEGTALQMVEVTQGNVLWMSSHYLEVVAWLTEHVPATSLF